MNRITKIEIGLMPGNGQFEIVVTKEFSEEHGGGFGTFSESAPTLHAALDVARGMVTWSPGHLNQTTPSLV